MKSNNQINVHIPTIPLLILAFLKILSQDTASSAITFFHDVTATEFLIRYWQQ